MFQGIVEQKGYILKRLPASIWVKPRRFWRAKKGDSVAVNGVCLTVSAISNKSFRFDLGEETLAITSLKDLKAGDWVNLEQPLRLGSPVHGHLVQGHVETTGEVLTSAPHLTLSFKSPKGSFVAAKGSLAVDGVSLTVNKISKKGRALRAEFFLIPETLKRTNLSAKKPGDKVNLETDYLFKLFAQKSRSTYGKN